MEKKPIITFIGAGNMASSLIGGLVADHYPVDKIYVTDPHQDKLETLKANFGIEGSTDNKTGASKADVLVFAVKPSMLKEVIEELKPILQEKTPLCISIVTGIESNTIKKWADCSKLPIVRCMPNTPALVRCGTTGLWANQFVTEQEHHLAESILRSVGITVWFDKENDLDVVTAISGSGPAYFFLVMEAMIDTAMKMGFDSERAQLLTMNTALGAARMALESGNDVTTLRKQVTSPGGTTEQAINVFEKGGLRDLFADALEAAKQKAIEMSKLLG